MGLYRRGNTWWARWTEGGQKRRRSLGTRSKAEAERLVARVREHDTRVLTIDVSEFHKKGGGSVKCMLADLGKLS